MRSNEREADPQGGFGLVEVMIAMSLLMVIAVAMLPVFVNTLRLSKETVSITTATQAVSEQMDLARYNIPPTCVAVQDFANQVLGRVVEDPGQSILVITMDAEDVCPNATSYPAAFRLTVTVSDFATGEVVAEAETRLVITSED
jgi:type II secretory pathway pseudopilin PulG